MSQREPRDSHWMLIAVLTSTFPLPSALAMRLYDGAIDLERTQSGTQAIAGDLGVGQLRRLGRDLLLGVIGGPGFEAELDTPQGRGQVRFIVTREGLERAGINGRDSDRASSDPSRWN